MVDTSVNLEGLLEKESGVFKKKSSVWVVLDSLGLSFYRPEKRSSCIGSVKVTDILTVRKTGHVRGNQFEVQTDINSYLFNTTNADLADTWVNAIQGTMKNNSLNGSETNPGHLCNSTTGQEESDAKESNADTSSIPSSTNIFGVKLKHSIKRPTPSTKPTKRQSGESTHVTQPIQPQAHINHTGEIRHTQPVSTVSPLNNDVNDQPETTGNQKPVRGAPPQPPQRKESLPTEESTKNVMGGAVGGKPLQTRRAQPSFKPPPPPTTPPNVDRSTSMAINGEGHVSSRNHLVTDENDNKLFVDVTTTKDEPSGSGTKGENVLPSNGNHEVISNSKTPTVDPSITPAEETVQVRKPRGIGSDKDIREKDDHSDVDTSGVEMRKSRNSRSNRNNSINDSWSTSSRSIDCKTNITAVSAKKIDKEPSTEASEELGNLEDIIGSLLSKGTDELRLESRSTTDVTIDLSAFVRLKTFLEDMAGVPFDVSSHRITSDNSVERLRSILCD